MNVRPLWSLVLSVGLALGISACSTSKPSSLAGDQSPHAIHTAMELNDGQKWVVVRPMMAHIRNLEKSVEDFERAKGQDHTALAATIQENLGHLVLNCTMEGKAHDELHKWLMPFMGLTQDYSDATDPGVQQEKLQGIRHALAVFNAFFM